jgi:hypothetical protein
MMCSRASENLAPQPLDSGFASIEAPRNDGEKSPIAVIVPRAVVEAVAMMVPVMRSAEHALDRAHGSAHASADRASDHSANRTRDPVAFIRPLLGAADDALAVAGMGTHSSASAALATMNGRNSRSRAMLSTLVLFISIP